MVWRGVEEEEAVEIGDDAGDRSSGDHWLDCCLRTRGYVRGRTES